MSMFPPEMFNMPLPGLTFTTNDVLGLAHSAEVRDNDAIEAWIIQHVPGPVVAGVVVVGLCSLVEDYGRRLRCCSDGMFAPNPDQPLADVELAVARIAAAAANADAGIYQDLIGATFNDTSDPDRHRFQQAVFVHFLKLVGAMARDTKTGHHHRPTGGVSVVEHATT